MALDASHHINIVSINLLNLCVFFIFIFIKNFREKREREKKEGVNVWNSLLLTF